MGGRNTLCFTCSGSFCKHHLPQVDRLEFLFSTKNIPWQQGRTTVPYTQFLLEKKHAACQPRRTENDITLFLPTSLHHEAEKQKQISPDAERKGMNFYMDHVHGPLTVGLDHVHGS